MERPELTGRQWISIAVSIALLALGIVVVQRSLGGPSGERVDLADSDERSDRDVVDDEDESDEPDGSPSAPGAATDTTAVTSSTTMPPRAQPVRLPATKPGPLLGAVIVVDPGHNGQNYKYADVRRAGSLEGEGPECNTAGSSTPAGLDEMVINWEIGTRLGTLLRQLGADVIMTHPDLEGFGPCADERGAIARDVNATALVSIHADGGGAGSSGFHVIFPAAKPELVPAIVAESGRLARALRDELLFIGGRPADYVGTGGVQERADLANLNTANRPAILAELGNLKNGTDAAMLTSKDTYTQIARALARALVRFVGKVADAPIISADVNGDGAPDLLAGAPQLATTTTTTTTTIPASPTTTTAPGTEETTPETTTSSVDTTVPEEPSPTVTAG